MAKHKSNGHSNGSTEAVRAPEGGVRAGGKFYPAGARMPARYRRQVADGEISHDPAQGVPLTPPNFGRVVLPHSATFIGKQSTVAHVYRNPDEAVLRSGGQAWKMRRDPSIMECLEARQRATALLGWHLEVEDEKDPQQKRLKDEMTKVLKRTYQFTEYRRNLLEALWYGRYAVQHEYGAEMIDGERRWVIKHWSPLNGDKLVFRFDDGSGKYRNDEVGIRCSNASNLGDKIAGPRKLEPTDQGMAYFLEPWERSLMAIHRHIIEDGDYEDPISAGRIHGVGIRDRIYWCWYQKQETMAQLMEVIDRTGSGITIYWYPAGDHTAKAEVEDMAKRQRSENVLIMPRMSGDPAMDAYGIERIEPTTAGIEAMRSVVDEFFGDQIMRYICGGTLFSKSKSLGIGGGGADIQEQSFYLIVQYDSVKLEETITAETVTPLKEFNCPWARDIPLWFRIDTDSPDSQEKLQAAKTLWDMGARIKSAEVMAKVGLSMPADGDEVLQNPAAVAQQPGMPGDPNQPGGDPNAEQPGSLQDLFGPLAGDMGDDGQQSDDGQPGDQPPGPPPPPGGPAQYAKQPSAGPHRFSSTQFNLPDDLTADVLALGRQINPDDLAADGLELEPHVTVKYGIHTDDAESVREVVQDLAPIAIQLGEASCFCGDQHDVLKIDVLSKGLHRLNAKISESLDVTDTYPDYRPHITIGYVKAGLGEAYAEKLNALKGRVAAFDRLIFSDKNRQHFSIPLTGPARYAKRQIRSSPGQKPLPSLGDANAKQHHVWREELHPRNHGQFAEKPGSKALPHQFGQGMLFSEMASKLHETEQYPDSATATAKQKELFEQLANSDVPPGQLHALLSGDDERLEALKQAADESDEMPPSSVPEPSTQPPAGTPGGSDQQDDEGGFSLQRQREKIGLGMGAGDKTPETSKGRQTAFFHGLHDAPGQEKLFGGLDLAGTDLPEPEETAAANPEPEVAEDDTPSPTAIAHPDEIPYETALNAHRGTSFVPETRAKQRQQDYADTLNGDYEDLSKLASSDEDRKVLADEFARYKDGYRRHYLEYLHANSRIVSTMIAGPSNFPAARMNKRSDTAHRRLNDLLEYRNKALAAIRRKVSPEESSAIKSSDSDAVSKLHAKLKAHEDLHARMKAVNSAHKKFLADPASLDKSDLSDDDKALVRNYKAAYSWEPHPFPPYRLTNNNATIKQVKSRIASVSQMQSSAPKEEEHDGVKLVENPEAGRIQLVFSGKPDEKTRTALKSAGFRWAPSAGAWQRHLNESGRSAANRVLASLKKSS